MVERTSMPAALSNTEATPWLMWTGWVDYFAGCGRAPTALVEPNKPVQAGERHLLRLCKAVDRVVVAWNAHAQKMPNYISRVLDSP